jgi:Tfp pilus assembly protein PilO
MLKKNDEVNNNNCIPKRNRKLAILLILAAVFIVGIATWFTLGDNSIARAITNQELAEKENTTSSKTNNAATTSPNKEITLVAEDFHCQKETSCS